MKDPEIGKSFLEDPNSRLKIAEYRLELLRNYGIAFYIAVVLAIAAICFVSDKAIGSLSSRIQDLETRLEQQENLTRETLCVDHKERITKVYNPKKGGSK